MRTSLAQTESEEDVRADNSRNVKPDAKLQEETTKVLAAKAKLEAEKQKKVGVGARSPEGVGADESRARSKAKQSTAQ